MIFVTVGSRNYPFDRLFKKLDELYEEGALTDSLFAQTGTSSYQPKHYEYACCGKCGVDRTVCGIEKRGYACLQECVLWKSCIGNSNWCGKFWMG